MTMTGSEHERPPQETPDLESSTDEYASRFAGPVGKFFLDVQLQSVLSQLPSAEDCQILDVGGGHGQLVAPLVRAGYNVTVFASDNTCRDRLDRIVGSGQYKLRTGNLLDLPCDSNQYDVVLAFRMLPHLNNWRLFLGETCRVAAHQVIFDYPDVCSFNAFSGATFALKRGIEKNTRRFQCFRRSQILAELQEHRFTPKEVRGQFFFPMALHRMARSSAFSHLTEGIAHRLRLTSIFGSPVVLTAIAQDRDLPTSSILAPADTD